MVKKLAHQPGFEAKVKSDVTHISHSLSFTIGWMVAMEPSCRHVAVTN